MLIRRITGLACVAGLIFFAAAPAVLAVKHLGANQTLETICAGTSILQKHSRILKDTGHFQAPDHRAISVLFKAALHANFVHILTSRTAQKNPAQPAAGAQYARGPPGLQFASTI